MSDIVSELGPLFLGSRLKRLGERMQGDVLRVIERAGLPIQPSHYPLLATLDRDGPLSVGEMAAALGVSQPGVTRNIGRLIELGYVEATRSRRDQRHKTVALTQAGRDAIERSKRDVWPQVEDAAIGLCAGLSGPLLEQLDAIEAALARAPLDLRAAESKFAGLSIREYSDEFATDFHDINAEWIAAMFAIEQTDRDVLEDPRGRIVDPGGDILFVEAAGHGIVGTCALQKTGDAQFELTKMGVLASMRGRRAGEYLLRATLRRAAVLGAGTLYLLTNRKCGSAISLYEKLGFVHDADIMARFGARYERCDVAMRYRGRPA